MNNEFLKKEIKNQIDIFKYSLKQAEKDQKKSKLSASEFTQGLDAGRVIAWKTAVAGLEKFYKRIEKM